MDLNLSMNNTKLGNIKLKLDGDIKFGEKIADIDTTNAISADTLTEEDTTKITENLMSNEALAKLLQELAPIFEQPIA